MKLTYREAGSGTPPLVLLHGFPLNSQMWEPQLDALSAATRVITPDLRGFGASSAAPTPYSMSLLADDVAELLDSLELPRAIIGGLSMGGYVTFEFYRRHAVRVAALILADTRPDADTPEGRANRAKMADLVVKDGSRAISDEMLPRLLASATVRGRPGIVGKLRAMMEAATPDSVGAALMAMANRADSRDLLTKIARPVLVIVGAEDTLTPATEVSQWARHVSGVRFEVIERAAHVPNLEQPQTFNTLVGSFIEHVKHTQDHHQAE